MADVLVMLFRSDSRDDPRRTHGRRSARPNTACLGTTLYLMLPMFNGADVIFRNVLVPIAGQREALLLKDAKMLAKTMIKQLPASRHGEAGEAVAQAFLDEAKKQGV